MKGLKGKTAIVTGGATMIGAAVVEVLRQAGVRVAVFDIDATGAARAVARHPETTRSWLVDITNDQHVLDAVGGVAAHFGGIDFLLTSSSPSTFGSR